MRYLFDSNTLSDLYDKNAENHAQIFKLFTALAHDDIAAVSILTIYEMQYALQNAPEEKQEKTKQGIQSILNNFLILPLSFNQSVIFGVLKNKFRSNRMINKENIKKHTIDIMLASCSINEKYCLINADKIYQDLKQFSDNLCV